MSFSKLALGIFLLAISGCGDTFDDLHPSGSDERKAVESGTTGDAVTQDAPDFTLSDTEENTITLSDEVAASDGVVLYFTMWCPICDSHMSHLRSHVIPDFPSVQFLVIDYVTGSVAVSRSAQVSSGYTDFTILVDTDQTVQELFTATMGTAVVIDAGGVVIMNEDFKDGVRIIEVLESISGS